MKIDFGKNDEPIKLDEMIRLLKNHETVTFKINGLGETTIDTILFKDVVEELERLAEIGRATEKVFEKIDVAYFVKYYPIEDDCVDERYVDVNNSPTFDSVEDLIDWYKED